jgi:hypothetical protein
MSDLPNDLNFEDYKELYDKIEISSCRDNTTTKGRVPDWCRIGTLKESERVNINHEY